MKKYVQTVLMLVCMISILTGLASMFDASLRNMYVDATWQIYNLLPHGSEPAYVWSFMVALSLAYFGIPLGTAILLLKLED